VIQWSTVKDEDSRKPQSGDICKTDYWMGNFAFTLTGVSREDENLKSRQLKECNKEIIRMGITNEDKIAAAKKVKFSLDEISEKLDEWKKDDLLLPEDVIRGLFDGKGICKDTEKEFLKACAVNQVYSTNLYTADIVEVAKYLAKNADDLNEKLYAGNAAVISDITCSIKSTQGKYCYSFATKYCSFVVPDSFPIYDSYLAALYQTRAKFWNPGNKEGFDEHYFDSWKGTSKIDANRYEVFRKAVFMMKDALAPVKKLTVKELDQYLWKAMKDYCEPDNHPGRPENPVREEG